MFTEDTRERMRLGTNSKWAADLTESEIQAVLWMVGEFGRRAPQVLTTLNHWAQVPPQDLVAAARAKLALEGLFRMVCGDRPSVEDYNQRWGSVSERVWAAAQSRSPDLPEHEMGDLWPIEWQGQMIGWLKDPTHERFGCTGRWIPSGSPLTLEFVSRWASCTEPLLLSVGGISSLVERPPSTEGLFSVTWVVSV